MISIVQYPKRRTGLIIAAIISLIVHVGVISAIRNASFLGLAMGLREIEFVEEEYDRGILIHFTKKLKYPGGYAGFRPPEKIVSLEEQQKQQERRRRLEAAERARR